MSKEDIRKRIEDLEEKMFLIDMIERWSIADAAAYRKAKAERDELLKQLNA